MMKGDGGIVCVVDGDRGFHTRGGSHITAALHRGRVWGHAPRDRAVLGLWSTIPRNHDRAVLGLWSTIPRNHDRPVMVREV